MKQLYVYSTLANDQEYTTWKKTGNDLPLADRSVVIKGGFGVADKKTIVTSYGAAVTQITESQLEDLRANEVFQMHEKNGFMVVKDQSESGEVAASDMDTKDNSAPLVPQDFAEGQAPIVAGVTEEEAPLPKSKRKS